MKYFEWNEEKNKKLLQERGISFEIYITYLQNGYLLDTVKNNPPREHQDVYIIEIEGYAFKVPFVDDGDKIFLKTIYPSHKATKKYLSDE
jgi:uncharacterized DUF497 family protein